MVGGNIATWPHACWLSPVPMSCPSVEFSLRSKKYLIVHILRLGKMLRPGKWRATLSVGLALGLAGIAQAQTFSATGNLNTAREAHTATLLQNGMVLVAGGVTNGSNYPLGSAELYDPSTGSFAFTGSMGGRRSHTATLMQNGQVLIAGGSAYGQNPNLHFWYPLSSAQLYIPSTGTFANIPSMTTTRSGHAATLLNNGMVLITGGNTSGSTAELYNPSPSGGTFTATGNMTTVLYAHTATLLQNGLVLVAGGENSSGYLSSAELYDPSTGTFTATGSMNNARESHTATLLNNGMVLITGGHDSSGYLSSAELYDPSAGTFTAAGSMTAARIGHTATLLQNGLVLVAGGGNSSGELSSAELYDPSKGTFTATSSMNNPRESHTATLLSNGMVLTAGGLSSSGSALASAELYQSGTIAPSIASLSPTSGTVGTSVTITGANFGSSQGTSTVAFNGTAGTPTSWSATSIAVPVPSGATTGNVVVTVGGIASNGVSFTVTVSAPSITSLNPTSGGIGTSVTITGTNFGSSQGSSTVAFNGTAATPTSWSATSIVVPVPSGATTGNVVVTVGGVASNGVAFTVVAPPTITSFTPTSAPIGTLVTVTGTNFTANNATPSVTLNQQGGGTIPASVSSASATSLSFVIPTGAATGPITVTANSQNAVSSTSLTITAASSFTLSATPANVPLLPGQTTTINVSLSSTNGFSQLAALSVSGLPSGVTAAFQPAQITAGQFSLLTLTASSGQAPGASGLTVTGSANGQGIAQSSSANVTLQVSGTSGVAFAGRVAVTDSYDTPLVGLTVKMLGVNQTGTSTGCTGSATTDGSGNFVLNGLSASCAGGQLVQYDPSTVTSPAGSFSGVTLSYQLTSGQVTTPGPPGFIVHLPRVDNAETFSVQQNTSVDQTFVSRTIPGVSITVYAGTTFTKSDGTQPSPFPLSVVEIPYDRLPEAMPTNPTQDPVFAMSIEPFNSSSSQPVAVSFPNRAKVAPGTDMPLTSLNPTMGIMQNYGTGTVSADGTQIVPDMDSAHSGHRYGISHFDWHFALTPPGNQPNPSPDPNAPHGGDPIDLASGLPVITKMDIVLGGARGQVGVTRVYRGGTGLRGPFGIGTSHNYGYMLDVSSLSGGLINLDMPDGNQIPFVQSGTIFVNSTLPLAQGAVISNLSCLLGGFSGTSLLPGGSECAATLRWKDGTTYQFQPITSGLIGGATFSPLASITDSNGNKTTLVRDPSGFAITQIIDPGGRALNLTYDSPQVFFGHILKITDPIGRTVQYGYDSSDRLTTVTDVNNGVTTYAYTDPNNPNSPTTIKDARNITYLTNTYDPSGSSRVTQQQTADGAITKFAYTQANPGISTSPVVLTTVTDPLGNQTIYHFNPSGFLIDVTDTLGRKTVYTRDAGTNLLLSVTDPLNRTTSLTYDPAGNVTSVTRLAGTPNAVTTSLTYDPVFNQLASITDPLGHTTSFGYDKAANLAQVTDPLGNKTVLGYDGTGELVSLTDPMGNPPTRMTYDGFGNVIQVSDPIGRQVSQVPDAAGRVQSVINALGQSTQYQYNFLNQVTQIIDPMNGQTSFSYDPNGNLLSVTDPVGQTHTTNYTYDNMDRVATRRDPLGNSESYQYDLNGNLIQFTDRRGKVTTYKYDGLNRLTFIGFGTQAGPSYESTISYTYDAGGRLIQATDSVSGNITRGYDNLDRLISETTPQGSLAYGYDGAGRRTSMTVSGQSAINYSFDNANRLTQITQGTASVTVVSDGDGRQASLTLPNGIAATYGYDGASQLIGINYKLSSTTLGNLTYSYDSAGRRTNVGGSLARTGLPSALTNTRYNAYNQLTQFGSSNLVYDSNGNLISDGVNTYTWNARNQLVSITGGVTASFQYDAFGRRVSRTVGSATQYLYDGVNPEQEIAGTSASANLLAGGVDQYLQRTDSAGTRSFLTDALGSTLALTDSTGAVQTSYTFEPFGNTTVTGSTTTNSYAYTGRELDTSGLYFYRARYYNPSFQRFIGEDPIGFRGGINLYAYAGNNPINNTDPFGLCTDPGGIGTRYCVEAYIPQSTAWAWLPGIGPIPFSGDNRGPQPNKGTFRFHQDSGPNGDHCVPGKSKLYLLFGVKAHMDRCDVTHLSGRKGGKRIRFRAAGGDGWGFGYAPDAWYDLTLTETDTGVFVTGFVTNYPNVEVWQYSDSGAPTLVFGGNTALSPVTGPPDLLLPNYIKAVPVVQNSPTPPW
jgi:RHS repeat-associated protein